MTFTIEDVAKRAKVSTATVSRVLNNSDHVSTKTRERVLSVVSELNYKPRSYKRQDESIKTVGIIFSGKFFRSIMETPFYAEVMSGVEESAKDYNFHLFFRSLTDQSEQDYRAITGLIEKHQIDGLLLVGYEIDDYLISNLIKTGIPMVLMDNEYWTNKVDCIVNDDFTGAKSLVEYLIGLGHRRIAFISGPLKHASLNQRYLGYLAALKSAGIKEDKNLIHLSEDYFGIPEGYDFTLEIFKKSKPRPTAIVAAIDLLAMGAVRAVGELGYSIPEDVSIAGYDDIEMSAHTIPPLTTVRNFKWEMGYLAGRRLYELINGILTKPIKHILSVEIIERESTGKVWSSVK